MKTIFFLSTLTCAQAIASSVPHPLPWLEPGPDAVRAPCPMLNALANHGFLPHDGKNITLEHTVSALGESLNMAPALSRFLFGFAITANPDTTPEKNATTFSLDHLNRHNILEHDASLSRADYYFEHDNSELDAAVFAETRSYWPPVIDIHDAARARQARINTSMATNPNYTMSELGLIFSIGETAAYIMALGDIESGRVNRTLVEYLFENERLPVELGWKRPADQITGADLETFYLRIVNASSGSESVRRELVKRGSFHIGRRG